MEATCDLKTKHIYGVLMAQGWFKKYEIANFQKMEKKLFSNYPPLILEASNQKSKLAASGPEASHLKDNRIHAYT